MSLKKNPNNFYVKQLMSVFTLIMWSKLTDLNSLWERQVLQKAVSIINSEHVLSKEFTLMTSGRRYSTCPHTERQTVTPVHSFPLPFSCLMQNKISFSFPGAWHSPLYIFYVKKALELHFALALCTLLYLEQHSCAIFIIIISNYSAVFSIVLGSIVFYFPSGHLSPALMLLCGSECCCLLPVYVRLGS